MTSYQWTTPLGSINSHCVQSAEAWPRVMEREIDMYCPMPCLVWQKLKLSELEKAVGEHIHSIIKLKYTFSLYSKGICGKTKWHLPRISTLHSISMVLTSFSLHSRETIEKQNGTCTGSLLYILYLWYEPLSPFIPEKPFLPSTPGKPDEPNSPSRPGRPGMPCLPGRPLKPPCPLFPGVPGNPLTPGNPGSPRSPSERGKKI